MTRYVIITPVRDEEAHLEATIDSVLTQNITPTEWIIVDDGSTDRTGEIIDQYAARFPFIRAVHRRDRGFRKAGGGVMEAFHDGYNALRSDDWDFIVKLDGDLSFSPEYFQTCFQHFREWPALGISGGGIYHKLDGQLTLESNPKFHVRGATKIYRRDCWNAIGGLWRGPGWDTIDEVTANMLGWRTCTFEELQLVHHRFTGSADGLVRDSVKHGVVCYICGYHPLFIVASCLYRLTRKPYIIGSIAIVCGVVKSYLTHTPRVSDKRLIIYLRQQQLRRLCGLETVWK
jgi:poly-beta-1,6-N-acetyl-D-glucosamine synthase